MKVTVSVLMQQPYMKNVQVLAGERSLSNQVDCVSVLEDVEAGAGTVKNTLLLTNGLFFSLYGPERLTKAAATYARIKTAAICLKMDRKEVHDTFLQAANRYSLPVLLLPQDAILSSIISGVTYEIFYRSGYNMSNSYEDNFIQEMVLVEQDRQMMVKRARMLGIKVDEYLAVLLVYPRKTVSIGAICKFCKEVWDPTCLICSRNGIVMIVLRMKPPYETTGERLRLRAQQLYELLRGHLSGDQINIGAGHCYEDVSDLRKSYYEARTALITGKMRHMNKGVFLYDQMGVYRILFSLKNRKELYHIQEETVDKLKKYDEENGTALLATVKTYLDEFCSIQRTAKAMFVHYNTIRYRMNKIKETFGWDLTDLGDCVYLFIGLNTNEYLEEENNA